MEFNEILSRKTKAKKLSKEEIEFAIAEIATKKIPDYKISSFLTAIYINGLLDEELYNFTIGMCNSGEIIDFSSPKDYIVDKHSTGGVGDKVTLIVTPILAALNIKIAKMSGRGLGITGGTIDKLNSVDIRTSLNFKEAKSLLDKYNMFIMEQTPNLVPVDGILYKLRDVTSTVDSIPLITSSIMSKKLAIKSNHIYLDVKVGQGAFFANKKNAIEFVEKAKMVARKNKRKLTCTLTDMNQPLGSTAGNRLEVYEALNFLDGKFHSKKLKELIYYFVGEVLVDKKVAKNMVEANKIIDQTIASKKPLKLFLDYAKQLGFKNVNKFEDLIKAKSVVEIKADKNGYFNYPNAFVIGHLMLDMKAGRKQKADEIDPYAGLQILVDENDKIKKGDTIAKLYSNLIVKQEWIDRMMQSIKITKEKTKNSKIILAVY